MKGMRIATAAALVAAFLAIGSGAQAHNGKDVTTAKAGPIVRGETTMRDMRDWFGDPDVRKTVRVGCVRVIKARWNEGVKVFASRGEGPNIVAAAFISRRTVASAEHGDLKLHTRKRLRVGDRERRLKRLYPNSKGITHAGHTRYRLRTGKHGGYVLGKVVDHKVVRLEVWPYEFC